MFGARPHVARCWSPLATVALRLPNKDETDGEEKKRGDGQKRKEKVDREEDSGLSAAEQNPRSETKDLESEREGAPERLRQKLSCSFKGPHSSQIKTTLF